MTIQLPDEPYGFLKAVEFFGEYNGITTYMQDMKSDLKDMIQTIEKTNNDNYTEIINNLDDMINTLYNNICKNVDEFKPLFYENSPLLPNIKKQCFNYVHGLFHSKLWNIMIKSSFVLQDSLILSACKSSNITNDYPHLVIAAKKLFERVETEKLTPEEVSNEVKEIFQLIESEVGDDGDKEDKIQRIIYLSQPSHIMSLYQYVVLNSDDYVINQLKSIIDNALVNGPIVDFVQETNVVGPIDD